MRHGGRVQENRVDRVDDDVVDGLPSEGYKSAYRLRSSWITSFKFLPSGTGGRAVRRRRGAAATTGRVVRGRLSDSDGDSDGAARVRISR